MASQFHIYFTLSLVFLSVNCLINNGQRSSDVIHGQNAARHSSASRFRRQSPLLGYKNYGQAVQPSVVVVPGVPNTVYRGSSYGTQSVPYGTQAAGYGVNRAPTVVVSVPDDNYMTPVLSNPYVPRI
ncbi:uncharacterized protein LOC118276776 isoform X2 [Spodoptera frugiperda]|uniref:Uncharacterized protein LOC118276776 isoform X2 n=1 Tax=Spodoptera frugiperda TaxID=7108 RepID=A0A9R0EZL1_SPOFR|nr:uncharacterized protein LOC118276776 isoform X2 [Spodoptera frugiperda]